MVDILFYMTRSFIVICIKIVSINLIFVLPQISEIVYKIVLEKGCNHQHFRFILYKPFIEPSPTVPQVHRLPTVSRTSGMGIYPVLQQLPIPPPSIPLQERTQWTWRLPMLPDPARPCPTISSYRVVWRHSSLPRAGGRITNRIGQTLSENLFPV